MELSWLMKIRIAAVCLVGGCLIGILAWPLAAPAEPFAAVYAGTMTFGEAITLLVLAFGVGILGCFLAWPYGRQIGVLAVPVGLTVWGVRTGDVAALMVANPAPAMRETIFATLRWEPLFWLAVLAAGFAGVFLGATIFSKKAVQSDSEQKTSPKSSVYLNAAIAVVGSALIAQFVIALIAQDVRLHDNRLGWLMAQPATPQILFAVVVAFGISGFIVKKFLNACYIWPTIAAGIVTAFSVTAYTKLDVLEHLAQRWPAVFFANASAAILPLQMVAFGAIGSIFGYWCAVRYNYWREHEFA